MVGTPTVGGGLDQSKAAVYVQHDGTRQLSYNGHLLYTFVYDFSAGTATGDGETSFYLLSPAGDAELSVLVASRSVWGLEEPGGLDRLLVISPHLDDAVLSCGALLLAHPGATVRDAVRGVARRVHRSAQRARHRLRFPARRRHDGGAARRGRPRARRGRRGAALAAACARTRTWSAPIRSRYPPGAVDAIVGAVEEVATDVRGRAAGPVRTSIIRRVTRRRSRRVIGRRRAVALVQRSAVHLHPRRARRAIPRAAQGGFTASPACPSVSHDFEAKWHAFARIRHAGAGARTALATPRAARAFRRAVLDAGRGDARSASAQSHGRGDRGCWPGPAGIGAQRDASTPPTIATAPTSSADVAVVVDLVRAHLARRPAGVGLVRRALVGRRARLSTFQRCPLWTKPLPHE